MRVAILPIDFDQSITDDRSHPDRKGVLLPLVDAMDEYVDSVGWGEAIEGFALPEKGSPYLYVGSSEGEDAPAQAANLRGEFDKYPPMVIHIEKPSPEWIAGLREAHQGKQIDHVILIRLGFSEYPKADKGFFGKKVVLGTGYEEGIRFLSAEDKPVHVLQLTGMMLDLQGNIIVAGAEGIVSEDSPFLVQVLELKKEIDNSALIKILDDERRDDLNGRPLKWQVALHNLMANLMGKNRW